MNCACGKPLHYTDLAYQVVIESYVAQLGPDQIVEIEGQKYLVQRHFHVLHGPLTASEAKSLADQGIITILCNHCEEPIWPGEPLAPILNAAFHHECGFRMGAGSVGHQKGECLCFDEVDTSEHGLTKREAAKAAFAFYLSCRESC